MNEQHLNSKKKKKKKKNKKKKAAVSEESKNNSSTCNTDSDLGGLVQPRDAKNTVIIGDSIVSKLSGWKMSDKTNRIRIRAFSGSKVEDMSDYIKPMLKTQPDNVILHTGTNNLRLDEPQQVAEKIVQICEQIEESCPKTIIVVSELTARQDSVELERKRFTVNKIIRSFSKSRSWKVI